MMGKIGKWFLLLFAVQLPAFHTVYAMFPGEAPWIFGSLIVWLLGWMTWFVVSIRSFQRKWHFIPLAFFISIAGAALSWITFLMRIFLV
jgi:hypothetical protein